jgi:hypothetical protein
LPDIEGAVDERDSAEVLADGQRIRDVTRSLAAAARYEVVGVVKKAMGEVERVPRLRRPAMAASNSRSAVPSSLLRAA